MPCGRGVAAVNYRHSACCAGVLLFIPVVPDVLHIVNPRALPPGVNWNSYWKESRFELFKRLFLFAMRIRFCIQKIVSRYIIEVAQSY